jgi:two-component system sensor histidine kinase QseC
MTTIRRQLTWKLLIAFAAPLIVGGVVTYALIRDELIEQFDSALAAEASAIGAVTRVQTDGTLDLSGSAAITRDFAAPEAGEAEEDESPPVFQIRRLDGASVARSVSLHGGDLAVVDVPRDEPRFWNLVLPSGVAGRAVAIRVPPRIGHAAADPGTLVIVAAVDRRDRDRNMRSIALLLVGCGSLLLVATFLVVPRVIRREFRPIDRLADQAGRITADSLGTRFQTDALPGELEPIGRRLNDLLGRLETSFDRERRFSADLAHELRTPLAELRSLAELAVKWPDARASDTDRDVLAIATQMEHIVTRLLAMVRSEHGQLCVAREPVNLDALLKDVWQPLVARAAGRDIHVAWCVAPHLMISADPVLLRSVLSNLLQNAVDYSPAGGEVTVGAQVSGAGYAVHVRNQVTDLAAEDVSRLFDRFWRRDPARASGDHAGLGLSLARAFARAMGGELMASREPDDYLRLTIIGQ